MAEPTKAGEILDDEALPAPMSARAERAIMSLGWPYVAVPGTLLGRSHEAVPDADASSQALAKSWPRLSAVVTGGASGHPLARRIIGGFGLMLGGSAGLFVGGLGAALLVALLHPFVPHIANLLLLSITLFSVAFGAIIGRRVLERETFE
ncbi:hypothetical protein [Enhygromyxa salina]|uniref:Transmembrane protein n=1 Tax=Enhygromyxa salina TaxID=215803 RepID=A0A2S9Y2J4_9BACT|nr:hypothetical protein [Enhygromyxa salina]PRP99333.1 hypothetical protein ENSA7_63750 [Enhygromyxa salina]